MDKELLDLLVCPLTKDKLIYDNKNNELISNKAGLAYPIIDDIPIMLPEKARKLDQLIAYNKVIISLNLSINEFILLKM